MPLAEVQLDGQVSVIGTGGRNFICSKRGLEPLGFNIDVQAIGGSAIAEVEAEAADEG